MQKTTVWMIFVFAVIPIIYLGLSYFLHTIFFVLLSIYGIIVLCRLCFQVLYSSINRKYPQYAVSKNYSPFVSVIVPTYNENVKDLRNCLFSIGRQQYPKFDVYLVDDGTKNEWSMEVYEEFKKSFPKTKIYYHKLAVNKGKRFAQKWAFDKTKSEVIVTVDSDTVLLPNSIRQLVKPFYDERVGAVTGNVRAQNRNINLLTRLIDLRYWMAFNQERGSQSLFGTTMCVSGVLGAYRTLLIKKFKEKYISQRFMGHICHFGDDRHLSNLVLNEGYSIFYIPKSVAYTNVPKTIIKWLKQQLRWNKSFYREIIWNIPSLKKQPVYMSIELFLQAVLPFFLLLNVGLLIYKGVTITPLYLLLYLLIFTTITLFRVCYAFAETRDGRFILFPIYTVLHLVLLVPLRVIALATLGYNGWGTR